MKFSAVVVAAGASLAAAQSIDSIPECARTVILASAASETTCSPTAFTCMCEESNWSKILSAATSPVITACGADVALNQVLPAATAFCEAVLAGGGSSSTVVTSGSSTVASTTVTEPSTTGTSTEASTTVTSGTSTKSGASTPKPSGSGTAGTTGSTGTTGGPSSVPTAGAAVATGLGSFAMLALGALAAF